MATKRQGETPSYVTGAGRIYRHQVYLLAYECDTPGPEVDRGQLVGYWDGHVTPQGSLKIVPVRGGECHYLFPREFTRLEQPE
jgi:hypothetical protein